MRELSKNFIINNEPLAALTSVTKRELVYCDWLSALETLIAMNFTDSHGEPRVNLFKEGEHPMAEFAGFFIKRSPLEEKFSKLVHKIKASGLDAKWEADVMFELKGHTHSDEDHLMSLTLDCMQGVFFLWIFANFGALSVCIFEVVIFRR